MKKIISGILLLFVLCGASFAAQSTGLGVLGTFETTAGMNTALGTFETSSHATTTYVPYTGATGSVSLGANSITATIVHAATFEGTGGGNILGTTTFVDTNTTDIATAGAFSTNSIIPSSNSAISIGTAIASMGAFQITSVASSLASDVVTTAGNIDQISCQITIPATGTYLVWAISGGISDDTLTYCNVASHVRMTNISGPIQADGYSQPSGSTGSLSAVAAQCPIMYVKAYTTGDVLALESVVTAASGKNRTLYGAGTANKATSILALRLN